MIIKFTIDINEIGTNLQGKPEESAIGEGEKQAELYGISGRKQHSCLYYYFHLLA